MEEYWVIAGHDRFRYPKRITLKKAKIMEAEGHKIYHSSSEARKDIEKGK